MRTVQIDVTWDDIEAGVPRHTVLCPVSYAVSRTELVGYRTQCLGLYPGPDISGPELNLPVPVLNWISHFDYGDEMRPISFEVEVPDA